MSRPALDVDPTTGNLCVYLTGSFSGSADFTGDNVADVTGGGAFILKLDATTGAPLWSRAVGGSTGYDIAAAAGSVYVAGGFTGTVDFDPGPNTRALTAAAPKGNGNPPDASS